MVDNAATEALVAGRHGDPFSILGLHPDGDGALALRAFLPTADSVEVIERKTGKSLVELEKVHPSGIFAGTIPRRRKPFPYRLRVHWSGVTDDVDDPYAFPPLIGEQDIWYLAEGTHTRPWQVFGAHPMSFDGIAGTRFAVWAPNARRVSVMGSFNAWDPHRFPMRLRPECGVWEIFIPGVGVGDSYKFDILGPHEDVSKQKADPFAFCSEHRPSTGSVVADLPSPPSDRDGAPRNDYAAPMAIYEVHPGSWRRKGDDQGFLSWHDLADQLIPYVKKMGFTHIELLPVSEHPFDGSWGYQPLGLYAPSSRFGSPADFQAFVQACHDAEIGVFLDWVPGHFPSDDHGLALFDGTHLFEHEDPRQGYHPDWNTLIYNYGRREVRNFLVANALYWLECYGIDGLRVDAVASMLYLDYSREDGEWLPNVHGGNENLEAIAFLREVNEAVAAAQTGVVTIAEESTAWPAVSGRVEDGGLGFNYKWNMGWMNDTLSYIEREPIHRGFHQNELTFGLAYAFNERFILPLSHDEVVHGKGSLIGKMPGDRWQKFANLRAYLAFMYAHPGKKLLFMGDEFAQDAEWNHDTALQWHLIDDPLHGGIQSLVRDLNGLYCGIPALHERDCEPQGFQWIAADDASQSVLAFIRWDAAGEEFLVAVSHFTPVPLRNYRIGVPRPGNYSERFNSDSRHYGGSDLGNLTEVRAEDVPAHGHPCSLNLTLPPLATVYLTWSGPST